MSNWEGDKDSVSGCRNSAEAPRWEQPAVFGEHQGHQCGCRKSGKKSVEKGEFREMTGARSFGTLRILDKEVM